MEETNFSSIQEKIDGLELLLSVYDESDSKYIEIEEKIDALQELQELYKGKEQVYEPKVITDGEVYDYLTKPSEKYKAKELSYFYKVIENIVKNKVEKINSANELKTKLDLIDIELIELKSKVNEFSTEIAYGLLWYNKSIGLKSLKYDISEYNELMQSKLSMDNFVIEFNRMPFSAKKNTPIKKRGSFLTNKDEIKLVKSIAGKDDLRPAMKLINVQDNYAVSTDAHTLVGLYDKSLTNDEKNYDVIDGKVFEYSDLIVYPKWKNIIPLPNQLPNRIKIDTIQLSNYLSKILDYNVLYETTYAIHLRINNEFVREYNAKFLKNTIDYFIKLGYKNVFYNYNDKPSEPTLFTTSEESVDVLNIKQDFAILMPLMYIEYNKMYINLEPNDNFERGGTTKNEMDSVDMMLRERRGI
ncbi:MAG: hypothetical protein ABF244_00525 [Flavobacteriaceae bacterium]